jgi:hypothetical protein
MAYFTIIHWFALVGFLILFIFLSIIALRQKNKKLVFSMLFANFLVTAMLIIISMYIIDKYTKKAILENVSQKRILITESFNLTGMVRNVGHYTISKCNLEVKLVSNAMVGGSNISGSSVFKPTAGLGFLFGSKKNERPSTVIYKFVIAKNFKPFELKNFTVSMKYPPYFKKPFMNYKLYCH